MRPVCLVPLVAAAAVLLPASAALASPTQKQAPSSAQQETEADRQIDLFFKAFYDRDYRRALSIADKLDAADNDQARGFRGLLRGAALLGLGKTDEARKLFGAADRALPDEPFASLVQLEAGLVTDHPEFSLAALDRMIARFPEKVRDMDRQQLWYVMSKAPESEKQKNDDRRVALARLRFDGDNGDYTTLAAVRVLMDRGDTAGAADLLRNIDEPQVIENLLIQKRYSALWPKIEEMAGPKLEKVRLSSVESAERDYAGDPTSIEKLQMLINALRHAGRLDEAIALRSKLPATRDAMASADEQVGWAVNNLALALHEAGRADEADALFELLNTAPIKNADWRVSMIINRLELLAADGRFDKAVALLPVAEAAKGSPYADQLVRRLKFCTLTRLDRKDEAEKVLPDLMAHAKDSYGATIDGLLCAGRLEEAEKLVLTAMKDDDFQEEFIRSVQPIALTADDPSIWQGYWKAMRQRPAVAKEFERLGRDMPAQFIPPVRGKI